MPLLACSRSWSKQLEVEAGMSLAYRLIRLRSALFRPASSQQMSSQCIRKQKRKAKFPLFSDHNGSLLRRQPGALVSAYVTAEEMLSTCLKEKAIQFQTLLTHGSHCFVSQDSQNELCSVQLSWLALAQVQAQASLERPLVCFGATM